MFAISFDMLISDLKDNYGDPYHNAYYEISNVLETYGFYRTQGSVYLSENSDLVNLTRAMITLKNLPWFRASVRDIRAFKVEDWSNFTDFMKENL
ncbi:MAG: virulence protein [Saprospiraceae bacterium]|jgi:virulence-associated protein VapD|nr:virulence protein [Saprospiraceae bacterium]MBK9565374.1 virulence protein [Saprospiraceae bacterium]